MFGVVFQARMHIDFLLRHPDSHVVAVCEVDKTRREDAKRRADTWYEDQIKGGTYKACQAFTDFRELIALKDVDAVLIGTPDHCHVITALEAVKAGTSV